MSGNDIDVKYSYNTVTKTLTYSGTGEIPPYYSNYSDSEYLEYRKQAEKVEISEGITGIGGSAFYNDGNLSFKSIKIPGSVKSIGDSAFWSCSALKTLKIPASVESIGNSTFGRCTNLESITIPDGVTSIGSGAFDGCSALTSVTIPASVKSIDNGAFHYCTNLNTITFNGTKAEWETIISGKSLWTTNVTVHCSDGDSGSGS